MSKRANRRGFLGATLASVAVAPAALAQADEPDATNAAVSKAVAECRHAAQAEQTEAQAAYGKALVAKFGPGVVDTIRDVTIARAKQRLESAPLEKRDLDTVKARLWDGLGPRFETRLVLKTPTKLQYEVHRCPYAEAMRRQDAPELGFAYYCAFDTGFCQGLNPAIRFTRTKTLMMGDSICDHTYELTQTASADGATKSSPPRAAS